MSTKTEYQKMVAGELYDAGDAELVEMRTRAREMVQSYNQTGYDRQERTRALQKILRKTGSNIDIQTPFYCDYGCHISVGNNFFANFNCVFLDCNYIQMGDNVFLGPNVQVYAATHPLVAAERIKGPELALPVIIGDNVWIGGGSIICPGLTIGNNTTIGAGSVVVKSIPPDVLAAGNPCRIIKTL
ncbi:MAG: sugar O-acetyltransferase [Ferruginibacter sp.]|nr:sugar O-acetyltransferase [Ferruginibacter sp.]